MCPLFHCVGEGLGMRAKNTSASHAVNLSSVPLSDLQEGGNLSTPPAQLIRVCLVHRLHDFVGFAGGGDDGGWRHLRPHLLFNLLR